jgi:hypothetical protein
MDNERSYLKTLEELERECILGLVELLHKEDSEVAKYALWDITGWHRYYRRKGSIKLMPARSVYGTG